MVLLSVHAKSERSSCAKDEKESSNLAYFQHIHIPGRSLLKVGVTVGLSGSEVSQKYIGELPKVISDMLICRTSPAGKHMQSDDQTDCKHEMLLIIPHCTETQLWQVG